MLSLFLFLVFLFTWDQVLAAPAVPIIVPIGSVIKQCAVPGTIALTFDDGPETYTADLIALLDDYQAHATFFVVGTSLQYAANAETLRQMAASGHQIGAHTYDHGHLPNLSRGEIQKKMYAVETAIRDILGYAPTYMRPPYLESTPFVNKVMGEMAYHVIGADVDTKDYENDNPWLIGNSFDKFVAQLDAGGSVVLLHDIEPMVTTLTRMILDELDSRELRGAYVVPVGNGEC
ncbi:conserved hypothetical protein [Aspergillus terreus NIH2624]|uniref:NodB homology domain-containing protein n=1 Tax=Aspergillus terreus (strain NIH 2624 / FGSC A1156) TaxID=341663 RepID=Q0CZY5_ASPTN|nr:uncharacterized protein ATEG_00749 [Aspergillus terreus NIH2624]EAU39395.1 conserved hypothetical protein [Aspergillus terreus NIH2624]